MNKQIEEMAKICCQMCKHEEVGMCFGVGKEGLSLGRCLIVRLTAEKLYNAGYRRQSENTDEVRNGHWLRYGQDELQCSLCGAVNNNCINNNYCPNCGAKMKGDDGK